MAVRRSTALIVAAYLTAAAILAALLFAELGQSRYDACMSIGAFSPSQCEDYARE